MTDTNPDDFLSQAPVPAGRSIVFFDVDGTLIDSYPGIRAGFLHALEQVGIDRPSEEFLAGIAGPPMEQTMRRLTNDPDVIAAAVTAYLAHSRGVGAAQATAFPGMGQLLGELSAEGYFLSTATSKGHDICRVTLDRLGMLSDLDFLAAAEEYPGTRRTKAAVIDYALRSLGLADRPTDILMIGDREHDYDGAHHYGIPTCLVTWGYGSPEEWAHADLIAHTPAELKEIIHDWSR